MKVYTMTQMLTMQATVTTVMHPELHPKDDKQWPMHIEYRAAGNFSLRGTDSIVDAIEFFGGFVHTTGMEHGFWDDDMDCSPGMKIALIHSEISEALEALRNGNPESTKIPGYSLCAEELADAVIRILDFAHHHGMDLAAALMSKAMYNQSRPFRHGKQF